MLIVTNCSDIEMTAKLTALANSICKLELVQTQV